MDVCWQLHCDLLIEELNPRTGATLSNWTLKGSKIIVEDQIVRRHERESADTAHLQ